MSVRFSCPSHVQVFGLQFNMLDDAHRRHVPMSELCAVLEKFPAEWKRQSRNALRVRAGLPIPLEDSMPIN
jgi:hypothetical protein